MKKTATKILLLLAYTFINLSLFGQGLTCADADPFCSDDPTYTFPASTGSSSPGSMGCLYTTPNPAWYFLQVDQPGRINIHMWTDPSKDLDFICWGPFTGGSFDALVASGVCNQLNISGGSTHGPSNGANPSNLGGYPVGNIIDCSYSATHYEYVHIPNAVPGNWYILLITNYSNQPTQINFQSHATSTGSTNCAIVRPFQGDTVCVGETATLTVENPPAGAYFTFEGPNGFFQSSTSPVANIPNAQLANAGTYSLVITPSGGAAGPPTQATLVVNPLPDITVTATNICPGENATVTATGASTYVWSTGQTGASITVSPTTDSTYTVTGTSAFGCVNTASATVNLYDNPIITITPNSVCSGDQVVVSSPTGVSYQWSDNLGDSTIINPIVTQPETYSVTVTDTNGCVASTSLTVNPDAVIEAFGGEICIGEQAEIRASGGDSYIWSNGMQGETIGVNPTFTMIYSVTGTNQFGCRGEDTTMVIVHPKPTANFRTPIDVISLDNPDLDFYDESLGASFWFWNFGDFSSPENTSILQNPIHRYSAVGHYTTWLVATSEFGCKDSINKVIEVENPFAFYIPNAFTPDKDGLNETFRPYGRGIDPSEYTMMIFDRWGTLIYKSNIPFASWDGYINGQRAPQGLYAYRFFIKDLEGKRREYSGHFTILR